MRMVIDSAAAKVAAEMGLSVEEILAEARALLTDIRRCTMIPVTRGCEWWRCSRWRPSACSSAASACRRTGGPPSASALLEAAQAFPQRSPGSLPSVRSGGGLARLLAEARAWKKGESRGA